MMEMEADRMVNRRLDEKEVLTERDVISGWWSSVRGTPISKHRGDHGRVDGCAAPA